MAMYGLAAAEERIEACFTPPIPGGCDPTYTIVRAVNGAHRQILVQAYEFTSAPIAKSIVDARKRGLDVRVILDKSNLHEGYSAAKFLQHEGVPVLIDSVHKIAHNKIIILDGETVVTGSFNFTMNAEDRNAENLLLIHDSSIASTYVKNWNNHASHSRPISSDEASSSPALPNVPTRIAGNENPGQVVGNRRSHIFAWVGCGSYDSMMPQNRVVFQSRTDAEAAGYRPAKNCP